ncbi:MAG: alternative ribosome rescue aminoacyl-tRNA hydrolase ArfB [Bacteriovoracia bacterium]
MALFQLIPGVEISDTELTFTFVRSSGPGGQNVNKVNSKAVLRWCLATCPGIGEELRARLVARLGPKLTRDGEVIVASDRFRDQPRNREDCLAKLRALLAAAAVVPKRRKRTKPSYSSVKKAETSKRRHSEKKRMRRGGGRDEY